MLFALGFLIGSLLPASAQDKGYKFIPKALDLQEMEIMPTCRQLGSPQIYSLPIVDLSFCRPKDFVYKWIIGSEGNCYELSADGDQKTWLVKTEPIHCKPEKTVLVFVRTQEAATFAKLGDKAHRCYENDVETMGKKYKAVAPLEKCRTLSPRITRLNYLGREGCYEVDSILGMDVWIRSLPEKSCTAPAAIDTSFRQVVDKSGPEKGQVKRAKGARPE